MHSISIIIFYYGACQRLQGLHNVPPTKTIKHPLCRYIYITYTRIICPGSTLYNSYSEVPKRTAQQNMVQQQQQTRRLVA